MKSLFKTREPRKGNARVWVRRFALILMIAALTSGAYLLGRWQNPYALSPDAAKEFALYLDAWKTVQQDYVDRGAVNPRAQTYGAIQGMLQSLGDTGHTRFLTPEEVKSNQEGLSGKYVGVGVRLEDKDKKVLVVSPIDGSPAAQAGIRAGDVLVAVDGNSVQGMDLTEVVKRVKGPEGTGVTLTMERGGKELTFPLKRVQVIVPAVTWRIIPGTDVVHLRLASFSADSGDEFARALQESQGAGGRRFILDMRDNPGGQVDQVISMAKQFLPAGQVIYISKDASGKEEKITVPKDAKPISNPVVVLVNGGTASSSEILSGALQDNGRAKVVGTKTFGTGTVLSEYTLQDGSAILLGTAEWLTPHGSFIRDKGIEPNIKSDLPEGQTPLTPVKEDGLSKDQILSADAQLKQAFETVEQDS